MLGFGGLWLRRVTPSFKVFIGFIIVFFITPFAVTVGSPMCSPLILYRQNNMVLNSPPLIQLPNMSVTDRTFYSKRLGSEPFTVKCYVGIRAFYSKSSVGIRAFYSKSSVGIRAFYSKSSVGIMPLTGL